MFEKYNIPQALSNIANSAIHLFLIQQFTRTIIRGKSQHIHIRCLKFTWMLNVECFRFIIQIYSAFGSMQNPHMLLQCWL